MDVFNVVIMSFLHSCNVCHYFLSVQGGNVKWIYKLSNSYYYFFTVALPLLFYKFSFSNFRSEGCNLALGFKRVIDIFRAFTARPPCWSSSCSFLPSVVPISVTQASKRNMSPSGYLILSLHCVDPGFDQVLPASKISWIYHFFQILTDSTPVKGTVPVFLEYCIIIITVSFVFYLVRFFLFLFLNFMDDRHTSHLRSHVFPPTPPSGCTTIQCLSYSSSEEFVWFSNNVSKCLSFIIFKILDMVYWFSIL